MRYTNTILTSSNYRTLTPTNRLSDRWRTIGRVGEINAIRNLLQCSAYSARARYDTKIANPSPLDLNPVPVFNTQP